MTPHMLDPRARHAHARRALAVAAPARRLARPVAIVNNHLPLKAGQVLETGRGPALNWPLIGVLAAGLGAWVLIAQAARLVHR